MAHSPRRSGRWPKIGATKLTFQALDELAFINTARKADLDVASGSYLPITLGPLIEFLCLMASGTLPSAGLQWLHDTQIDAFLRAWCHRRLSWLSPDGHLGFISTTGSAAWETDSVAFLMEVQRGAREISKLPGTIPGQMAAAILELVGNIEEHSGAVDTGVIAFRASAGAFEFVVADQGVGVLRSLRGSPEFLMVDDHGRALELALPTASPVSKTRAVGMAFGRFFRG